MRILRNVWWPERWLAFVHSIFLGTVLFEIIINYYCKKLWSYDLQRALVWNLVLVFSEHLEITYWPSGIAFSFCSSFFWHWFYVPICPDVELNMNLLNLRFSQHTVWQLRQMQLQARSDGWQVWPLPAWIPFPHRGRMQVNVFRTRDGSWICTGNWEHFSRRDGQQASRLPWWCPWGL